ncbi:hypothetical protein L596_012640 [Steinernema carpocapsae]|uniref:Uncharacterized protein n=1 Tax=Steinernema carpocapsae TaxID=34508 RepID=A0A4U5NXW0_STECR|nr:hypothetical protein L596_012640 [Steinernema carpocapsae]
MCTLVEYEALINVDPILACKMGKKGLKRLFLVFPHSHIRSEWLCLPVPTFCSRDLLGLFAQYRMQYRVLLSEHSNSIFFSFLTTCFMWVMTNCLDE